MSQKNNNIALAFIFLFLFFVLAENSFASVAELQWNPNSEPDLAGYKIYWGTSVRSGTAPSGGYANNATSVGIGTSYTISNISDTGTTYFSLTAYDTSNNESVFSVEVHKTPGDTDKNGTVDMLDLITLVNNYNVSVCDNAADIDLNCAVDMLDLIALVNNYGATTQ